MLLRARGLRLGADATTAHWTSPRLLRRAGRARRRRDLQRQRHEAGRRGQRDAVQIPRHAAGGEAPARLAPGSSDELPGLLHVLLRQAQDRRPRELLRRSRRSPTGNILFRSLQLAPAQAVVQPPDRQLRRRGFRLRQQQRGRLRYRPRHADRRRRGSAVPEIQRQPLRHVHQVAGGADHQHSAARGVGRHQRRGVESRAPDRRSRPRCSRSTRNRGWSAR